MKWVQRAIEFKGGEILDFGKVSFERGPEAQIPAEPCTLGFQNKPA